MSLRLICEDCGRPYVQQGCSTCGIQLLPALPLCEDCVGTGGLRECRACAFATKPAERA